MSLSAMDILNQFSSGICIIDTNQKIIYRNRKSLNIFGNKLIQDNLYANMIFPYIPENMRNINKLPAIIAMQSGKELNYTLYITKEHGNKIPVDCIVSPIFNNENKVIGASENYITGDIINKRIKKTQMHSILSQFVSKSALEFIEAKANKREDSIAIKKYKTMVFLDIVGFTSLSERYEPLVVINILNNFYQKVYNTIKQFDGDIDKFIGDAMLIIFSNSENAVRCATDIILKDLPIINAQISKQFSQSLQIHVGINSGWVIIGELGSAYRKDFTVIGDNVNIASRIESLTPPNEVWISGSCMSNLGKLSLLFDQVDTLNVKGKKKALTLYKFLPEKLSMSKRVLVYEKKDEVKSDLKFRLRRMGVKEITIVESENQLEREAQIDFDNMLIGPTANISEIPRIQKILEAVGRKKEIIVPIRKDIKPESILALEKMGIHTVVAYDETENFDISLKNALKSQSIKNIKAKEQLTDEDRKKLEPEETDTELNITGFQLSSDKENISIEIFDHLREDQIHSILVQAQKIWGYEFKESKKSKFIFQFDTIENTISNSFLENLLTPFFSNSFLNLSSWNEVPVSIKTKNKDLESKFTNIIKKISNQYSQPENNTTKLEKLLNSEN
ncbi:MAG: PAS domain-containing protein [Spirochaetia bacterium]|nr:PAS domain-containing protein [Spirochaetia bacterium]